MTLGHRSTWQCTPHALAPKSRGKEKDVGRSGDLDTLLWGGFPVLQSLENFRREVRSYLLESS